MTRRGSPEERDWRRDHNLEPGSDGSIHGEQPVDPRGRKPREKPSSHRHADPQPAKVHDNAKHDPPMVENAGGAPQAQRGTRAAQPSPANVPVGSRYIVSDEANLHEVAVDSDSDGTADSWEPVSATEADHGNERHTPSMVVNRVGSPSLRRGLRTNQPSPGNVTEGGRYVVADESNSEEIAVDTQGEYQDTYEDDYGGHTPDAWTPRTDPGAARDPHDDEAHKRSHVDTDGDTMTGTLNIKWSPVGVTVRDGNNTPVVRIDNPERDRSRFGIRERDGSDAGSGIDLANSSHAEGNRTRVRGTPVELRGGDTQLHDGDLYLIGGATDAPSLRLLDRGTSTERLEVRGPTGTGGGGVVRVFTNGNARDVELRYRNGAALYVRDTGEVEVLTSLETAHGMLPSQFGTASDSRDQNIVNSDHRASGSDDHVTIQNAIDALPVGTK